MRLYEELMMFNKITINFNYGENKKPYHKITKLKFCARTDIKKNSNVFCSLCPRFMKLYQDLM